jgi:hypothetical protein
VAAVWRCFFLLVMLPAIAGARASDNSVYEATFTYPSSAGGHRNVLFESPRGVTYELSLVADPNIDGRVEDLELVLRQPRVAMTGYPNLLAPRSMWHGYQPFFFAGSDYAHGVRRSIYGETRTIDVPRLGMRFLITVPSVHVAPVPNHEPGDPGYRFVEMTLRVVVQSL